MKIIEINYGIMEECIENLSTLRITKEEYSVRDDIRSDDCIKITTIELNSFQLWCIFGVVPRSFPNGKTGYLNNVSMYEYTIVAKNGDIFSIYSWGKELVEIKEWYIASNSKDGINIQNFLEYLFGALKCYNMYYRSMEHGIFESDIPIVDERMKQFKQELLR